MIMGVVIADFLIIIILIRDSGLKEHTPYVFLGLPNGFVVRYLDFPGFFCLTFNP